MALGSYEKLLDKILSNGVVKDDRTKTGTTSLFGESLRYDLSKSFPLITTKKVYFKAVIHELFWLLSGSTNIKYLKDNGINIWNEWADENGELGPVYGKQWRYWPKYYGGYVDQIKDAIALIKHNHISRRILVSAWNVAQIDEMRLPPCHCFFQFYVAKGKLSCQVYLRSVDMFLGMPFDIASYALLTHMMSHVTNLDPGELIIVTGDTHIYLNHIQQAKEQLSRDCFKYNFPQLRINPNAEKDIDKIIYSDIELTNYLSFPSIKAPIAI